MRILITKREDYYREQVDSEYKQTAKSGWHRRQSERIRT